MATPLGLGPRRCPPLVLPGRSVLSAAPASRSATGEHQMIKPPIRVVYEKPKSPSPEMRYSLDVYDVRGNWVEQLGQLNDLDPARAAFAALCAKYPDKQ